MLRTSSLINCLKTWLALFTCALLVHSCGEAPRDNPLDPLAPHPENLGQALVRVQSFYPPYSPLSEFALLLTPGNILLHTDAEGNAQFTQLAVNTYTITADKDGYVSGAVTLDVRARQTSQHTFRLNAVPQITSTTVYSEHISRWFPINRDVYRLVLAARVTDADGEQDIVSVKAASPNHGELGALAFRSETGRYELALGNMESALQDFLGEPITLTVNDREAATSHSTPFALARVIETTPAAEMPAAFSTTGARPLFKWRPLTLPYHFTFRLDISQFSPEQQFATLFESLSNIPSDSSATSAPRDLPDGTYYWTVSIIDRQGNVSRSKEATFLVE